MNSRFLLVIFLFLLLYNSASAQQSIQELRQQKERTTKEIALTQELIRQAQRSAKISSHSITIINRNIMLRNNLINMMNSEINVLDGFIDDNRCFIDGLRKDLVKLRTDYARTIQMAQLNRKSQDKLLFILSAKDFNQAYKRLIYMRQYTSFREKQADHIKAVFHLINVKLRDLANKRLQKDKLKNGKEQEKQQLNTEKRIQASFLRRTRQEQQSLQRRLRTRIRAQYQIQREIERLIAEEAKKATKKGTPLFETSPENKIISGNFERNKGRLPWPVEKGIISESFGTHELMQGVTVRNNGIDFTTPHGGKARTVFEGEVSRVIAIPGGSMAVIIRHGKYMTVYSNLQSVFVHTGQKVRMKEDIGIIYTDPNNENKTILKFQIWKEATKLNPENWIAK